MRREWVIVLLNELGGVCLRVSVRVHGVHEEGLLDPTEFLSRDVCGHEGMA